MTGTAIRPRLSVFRSLNHIYAQIIDDEIGHTIVSASSLDKSLKETIGGKTKRQSADLVGSLVAHQAHASGIKSVVFDRGGYKYFGRLQALAEAARKGGLEF